MLPFQKPNLQSRFVTSYDGISGSYFGMAHVMGVVQDGCLGGGGSVTGE